MFSVVEQSKAKVMLRSQGLIVQILLRALPTNQEIFMVSSNSTLGGNLP